MPTTDPLTQVTKNVAHMMDFINHVHLFFSDKLNEAYMNLKSDENTDQGQKFISALLDSVFWSLGGLEFEGATVFASFLGTFFGAYAGPETPPSLDKIFAKDLERLDATIAQSLDDLSLIHDNPAAYWNKTYTNPFNNKTVPVSSLGGATLFPDKHASLFQKLSDATVFQFRHDLTMSVLPQVYYVYFSNYWSGWDYGTKEVFFKWASDYVAKWPAYFFKYRPAWVWSGGKRVDVIQYFNFSLIRRSGSINSVLSDELCKWLFQDDGYGHQTNADGVARRFDVFFSWGLEIRYPNGKPFGIDGAMATAGELSALPPEQVKLVEGTGPGEGPKPLPGPPAKKG
jgi:hypothetical protein